MKEKEGNYDLHMRKKLVQLSSRNEKLAENNRNLRKKNAELRQKNDGLRQILKAKNSKWSKIVNIQNYFKKSS